MLSITAMVDVQVGVANDWTSRTCWRGGMKSVKAGGTHQCRRRAIWRRTSGEIYDMLNHTGSRSGDAASNRSDHILGGLTELHLEFSLVEGGGR